MPDIIIALILDVIVLGGSTSTLLKYGRLSAFHPAPIYLFFHFYTMTLRILVLTLGVPLAVMPAPFSIGEIIRATLTFDAALVGATFI